MARLDADWDGRVSTLLSPLSGLRISGGGEIAISLKIVT